MCVKERRKEKRDEKKVERRERERMRDERNGGKERRTEGGVEGRRISEALSGGNVGNNAEAPPLCVSSPSPGEQI